MVNPITANEEIRQKWENRIAEAVQRLVMGTAEAGHSLTTPAGRDHLIQSAIRWDLLNDNRSNALFIELYFWPEIERLTGVDSDYIFGHLETVRQQIRQEKHDQIITSAFSAAAELCNMGEVGGAKEGVDAALNAAAEALAERPAEPVKLLSDCITEIRSDLLSTQGVRYTGFIQRSLPKLDDATGGLRGLVLLAGKSGTGKTILALQNTMDILKNRSDVSALILSMDMLQRVVWRRMVSHCAMLSLWQTRSGSTETGWNDAERIAVEKSLSDLSQLGKRIAILDRFNYPNPSRASLVQRMARHMDTTNTEHILLVVDLLELWPAPEKLKTEYDRESWQIDDFRTIADNMNEDALYALCKSGKGDAAGAAIVKGNADKVQRADIAITIEEFKDDEINKMYDINNDYPTLRAKKEPFKGDAKAAADRAKEIRERLSDRGESPLVVSVVKGRDGAKKTSFNAINHFEKNLIRQMG